MPQKFKRAKWAKVSDAEYRKDVLGLTLIAEGKFKAGSELKTRKLTRIYPVWGFRVLDSAGALIIDGAETAGDPTRAKTLTGKGAKDFAMGFARLGDYHAAIGLPPADSPC